MPYEIATEQFKGPLEKLLELIEQREVDITQLSLAAVTDDFLAYLKTIAEAAERGEGESKRALMRLLADFVAVASRLILLKSKALLPSLEVTEEEEQDIKDLELRLRLFKRLKPAMKALAAQWEGKEELYARSYLAHISESRMFYPGRIDAEALHMAMAKLAAVLEEFTRREETISETIVTLEERMQDILSRITAMPEMRLGGKGAARADIIITFLAILHLARDRAVSIEQEGNFSDIIIRKPQSDESEGGFA